MIASYVLGLPDSAGRIVGSTAGDMYGNGYSLYAQDTFRVNNRLTLNFGYALGIRRSHDQSNLGAGPLSSRRGSTFGTRPTQSPTRRRISARALSIPTITTISPASASLTNSARRPWLRSSFGIFDDIFGVNYAQTQQGNRGNWPFSFPQTVAGLNTTTPNAFFPNPFPGPAAGSATPLGCLQCLNVFHDSSRTPYVMEWTFSLQRQITPTLVAEAVYFGSRGVRISGQFMDNTAAYPGPGPVAARTAEPTVSVLHHNGYNEFQFVLRWRSFKLDKRLSKGLLDSG